MPREEWGVKRVCPTTGRRFYDLNKSPVVSPYTGEVVDLDGARRKTTVTEAKPVAKAKEKPATTSDETEAEDPLLADDDVEVDDDLLEDDDDDSVSLDDIADVSDDEES